MRKLSAGAAALFIVLFLSSCALAPVPHRDTLYVDSDRTPEQRVDKIIAAVNSHDAASLKALFSKRALEKATELDAGVDYLFSLFPHGGLTKEWGNGPSAEREYKDGKVTEMLLSEYKVSAGGHHFSLFFADFTVNEVIDPDNVGLYGLGVTPWTKNHHSWLVEKPVGAEVPFFFWAGSIHADESDDNGYPGIYVPR